MEQQVEAERFRRYDREARVVDKDYLNDITNNQFKNEPTNKGTKRKKKEKSLNFVNQVI